MRLHAIRLWLTAVAASIAVLIAAVGLAATPTQAEKDRAAELVFLGDERRAAGDHAGALVAYQQADAIMDVPTTGLEVARELVATEQLETAHAQALYVARSPAKEGEPAAFARARIEAKQLAAELVVRMERAKNRHRGQNPTRPQSHATERSSINGGSGMMAGGIALMVTGGLGIISGVALVGYGAVYRDVIEEDYGCVNGRCPSDAEGDLKDARAYRTGGLVFTFAGLSMLTAGIPLIVVASRKSGGHTKPVAPRVLAGPAGVSVRVAF